ncbi:MAG: hypothetical protein EBR09_11950 [Proteobacteria bacterium]|jgi:hypothetical protein|nr:hypothetical protein [Pseudomonadota bacterium]
MHNLSDDTLAHVLVHLTHEEGAYLVGGACKRFRALVQNHDHWQPCTPSWELQKTLRRVRAQSSEIALYAMVPGNWRIRIERLVAVLLDLHARGVVTFCAPDFDKCPYNEHAPLLGFHRLQVWCPHQWVLACETLALESNLDEEYMRIVLHKYDARTCLSGRRQSDPPPPWIRTLALWFCASDLLSMVGLYGSHAFSVMETFELNFFGTLNPLLYRKWTYAR